ncbi:MAG: 30S ribosome-binding factor RbfA [Catonella sp.]|jgi:ribosome-binding factor A|nr:30S ribosome-binding factor RbfA [Catonella sp.]MDY6355671.1 30S ribosome-binding factor RbfA [Catonella sp.]
MRKNSIKNVRINSEVKKELAELIRDGVKDPRVSPFTSVTDVEVAPDLKTAKVYISVLGDEEKKQSTLDGLKSAMPYLRSQLARTVNLRITPELRFLLDNSIEYGMRMSELIDEVTERDKEMEERK